MTEAPATYTVQLANTPDGDGDYLAEVFYCGESAKLYFRPTREEALAAALEAARESLRHEPLTIIDLELRKDTAK